MLSAETAQAEIARIQPGELITSVELPGYTKHKDHIELYRGVAPEGSPLDAPDIDLIVAGKGVHINSADGSGEPYVFARFAVEHTPGQQPAVVDIKAQLLSEKSALASALPKVLKNAGVRRANLFLNRANIGAKVIQEAGYAETGTGAFLVTAA